jgi:hypothetical protein
VRFHPCCLFLFAGALAAQQRPIQFMEDPAFHRQAPRIEGADSTSQSPGLARAVGDTVTLLEEPTLVIPPGQPDGLGQGLFRFVLAPGETVAWQLTFDAGELAQSLRPAKVPGTAAPSASTRAQLERMNGWGRAARNKGLIFTNHQKEPLPLILVVEGDIGQPFRVAIQRRR